MLAIPEHFIMYIRLGLCGMMEVCIYCKQTNKNRCNAIEYLTHYLEYYIISNVDYVIPASFANTIQKLYENSKVRMNFVQEINIPNNLQFLSSLETNTDFKVVFGVNIDTM